MNIYELKKDLFENKGVKKIILDTDTYNEIDDQYALTYALLSKKQIEVLSVNAAPFYNRRSSSPKDGMEKSYEEIQRVISNLGIDTKCKICRGSDRFLTQNKSPVESEAADNIIKTVTQSEEPVYIVAIGAITNVASAILKCPEIVDKTAVIWLGGVGLSAPAFPEFNLKQDVFAAQTVFDSGISLVHIPTFGVSSELITSIPEMRFYLENKNPICNYLLEILENYSQGKKVWSKVIWDIANIGLLNVPEAYDAVFEHTPIIQNDLRYSFDPSRHMYIYIRRILRDKVFADFIEKATSKNI